MLSEHRPKTALKNTFVFSYTPPKSICVMENLTIITFDAYELYPLERIILF